MAQQPSQQEPTMEEILASIRRIISEDAEEPAPAPAAAPAPQPVRARQPEPEPQPVEEEEVLELDQVVEEEPPVPEMHVPEPPPPPPPPRPAVMRAAPPPPPRRAPEPAEEEDVMLVDDDGDSRGLLSQGAANAMANAFGQLHQRQRITDEPGNTLEDIVRAMLKPMLQDWLESNLPAITERLVQEEIDRVSRANRRR